MDDSSNAARRREWNNFSEKYNCLIELMEKANINTDLLKDLLDAQLQIVI